MKERKKKRNLPSPEIQNGNRYVHVAILYLAPLRPPNLTSYSTLYLHLPTFTFTFMPTSSMIGKPLSYSNISHTAFRIPCTLHCTSRLSSLVSRLSSLNAQTHTSHHPQINKTAKTPKEKKKYTTNGEKRRKTTTKSKRRKTTKSRRSKTTTKKGYLPTYPCHH